jgi:hypothetical protein
MGGTYANSTLNIFATASSSGLDGLFFMRNPVSVAPCKWRAYFGEKGNVTLGELTTYSNGWTEEVIQAPISTRAWAFQENSCTQNCCTSAETRYFRNVLVSKLPRFTRMEFRIKMTVAPMALSRKKLESLEISEKSTIWSY